MNDTLPGKEKGIDFDQEWKIGSGKPAVIVLFRDGKSEPNEVSNIDTLS